MTLAETEPVKLNSSYTWMVTAIKFFHELVSSTNKRNLSFAKGIGIAFCTYISFMQPRESYEQARSKIQSLIKTVSCLPFKCEPHYKIRFIVHYKIRFTLSTFVTICSKFISLSTRARVSSQCVFTNLIAAMKRTCWVTFVHVCNDKTNIIDAREYAHTFISEMNQEFPLNWKQSSLKPNTFVLYLWEDIVL